MWAQYLQGEKPREEVDRQMKKWVIDVDTGGGMKQGERERDERRRSNNSRRYASDYQPVSGALETDKEEEWTTAWQEERNIEKEDASVYASRAAKMTDTKSVSSVEAPGGKLLKKVSGCSCQNIEFAVS